MELDNKYIVRILGAAALLVGGLYLIRCYGAKKPATEESELLVSGVTPTSWFWRPGGKTFPTSTDVYWCAAQNEDFGSSLTLARNETANPDSLFPLKRGMKYGY